MTVAREDFQAIEIDALDDRLAETALRKRIPSLTLDRPVALQSPGTSAVTPAVTPDVPVAVGQPTAGRSGVLSGPEPTHRPGLEEEGEETSGAVREVVRRRPLSLEVPAYLARELKVKAATEAVTVRFLVLSALAEAGYRVDSDELEEDGRRLR